MPVRQVAVTVVLVAPTGICTRMSVASTASKAACAEALPASGSVIVRLLTARGEVLVPVTRIAIGLFWPATTSWVVVQLGSLPPHQVLTVDEVSSLVWTVRVSQPSLLTSPGLPALLRVVTAQLVSAPTVAPALRVPTRSSFPMALLGRSPVYATETDDGKLPGHTAGLAVRSIVWVPVGFRVRVTGVALPRHTTLSTAPVAPAGGVTRTLVTSTLAKLATEAALPGLGSVTTIWSIGKPLVFLPSMVMPTPEPCPANALPSAVKSPSVSEKNFFVVAGVSVLERTTRSSQALDAPAPVPFVGLLSEEDAQFCQVRAVAVALSVPTIRRRPLDPVTMVLAPPVPVNVTETLDGNDPGHRVDAGMSLPVHGWVRVLPSRQVTFTVADAAPVGRSTRTALTSIVSNVACAFGSLVEGSVMVIPETLNPESSRALTSTSTRLPWPAKAGGSGDVQSKPVAAQYCLAVTDFSTAGSME